MVWHKKRFHNPFTRIRGFTVIEMIISIVILGILGVYTFSFLGNSMGAYVRVRDHKTLYDEARIAMRRMADEIEDANRNAPITITPNTSIVFTKTHPSATMITYILSGSVLNRVSGGVTNALTGNVQTFNPAVDGTTKVVTLELVQAVSGGGTVRFRTMVYPRNTS
jgi:prepilin-type N-terminal cleavage/methylation domain-containing protein